jgi:transcriptional regulator with XRE-family HTH domain
MTLQDIIDQSNFRVKHLHDTSRGIMSLRTDRLRTAREHQGLTQRQLAELCGIGENQIHRYENGKMEPTATSLKMVAEKLHVSADYLLGLSDNPGFRSDNALNQDERKFLEAYIAGDSSTIIELMSERLRTLREASKPADATIAP